MSEMFINLAFWTLATLVFVSSILVVVQKNLIHAAIGLFVSLASVAGLYILLGADFVGMAQLLVYAGGVLVLIIFGVFLTSRIYQAEVKLTGERHPSWLGGAIALGIFITLYSVISKARFPLKEEFSRPSTTEAIGELFLTKYLLPFEMISILLVFAMIGAVILVRKEVRGDS